MTLYDAGLQPERTELAWRRTALAIGVGSLLALRVLPSMTVGRADQSLWVVPGLIGVAFGVWLWILSRARYRRTNHALLAARPKRLPGAGLLLTLMVFVLCCGVLSAVVTVHAYLH